MLSVIPLLKPATTYAKNNDNSTFYFSTDDKELPEPAKAAIAKAQADYDAKQKAQAKLAKREASFIVYTQLTEAIILDPSGLKEGVKVGDGWCVTFAKAYLGISGTWGYGGRNLSVNSKPMVATPENRVVILFGKKHVGVPIFITSDGYVVVAEANYHLNKRVTLNRTVKLTDPSIRGFHKF